MEHPAQIGKGAPDDPYEESFFSVFLSENKQYLHPGKKDIAYFRTAKQALKTCPDLYGIMVHASPMMQFLYTDKNVIKNLIKKEFLK